MLEHKYTKMRNRSTEDSWLLLRALFCCVSCALCGECVLLGGGSHTVPWKDFLALEQLDNTQNGPQVMPSQNAAPVIHSLWTHALIGGLYLKPSLVFPQHPTTYYKLMFPAAIPTVSFFLNLVVPCLFFLFYFYKVKGQLTDLRPFSNVNIQCCIFSLSPI